MFLSQIPGRTKKTTGWIFKTPGRVFEAHGRVFQVKHTPECSFQPQYFLDMMARDLGNISWRYIQGIQGEISLFLELRFNDILLILYNGSAFSLFSYYMISPLQQQNTLFCDLHQVKSVHIRSYSGPYFPAFELNTERYGVSLRIQSKCRKIRTRITLNTDTFHTVMFKLLGI